MERSIQKLNISYIIYSCILIFSLLTLVGCSRGSDSLGEKRSMEIQASEEITQTEESSTEEISQIAEAIDL